MSERYTNWITILEGRDSALWSIFILAALFVSGWCIVGTIPEPATRNRLQALYVVGGVVVFYGSLLAVVFIR